MERLLLLLGIVSSSATNAASNSLDRKSSALVIRLPSRPNPPERDKYAGRLFHGKLRWADRHGYPTPVDPVQALTEAALSCGQRSFQWRGLNTDHGNQLLIANSPAAQRALSCIASKVSFDFYTRVEPVEVR